MNTVLTFLSNYILKNIFLWLKNLVIKYRVTKLSHIIIPLATLNIRKITQRFSCARSDNNLQEMKPVWKGCILETVYKQAFAQKINQNCNYESNVGDLLKNRIFHFRTCPSSHFYKIVVVVAVVNVCVFTSPCFVFTQCVWHKCDIKTIT